MNFHYAACTYLNEYVVTDEPCIESLQSTALTDDEVCEALSKMATDYGISRNFSDVERLEWRRYRPVLQVLRTASPPAEDDGVDCVLLFEMELKRITGKDLLSAASKMLWMRFKHPIVIYDSLTWKYFVGRGVLNDTKSSYGQFCSEWRAEFDRKLPEIQQACRELIPFRRFTLAKDMDATKLEEITGSLWFHERVFDHAIVNLPK
jgi:hypothetical protein